MPNLPRSGLVAGSLLLATTAFAADVTPQRLLNGPEAEPQNWLTYHLEYSGARYSHLDIINRDNAKDIRPVFATALGGLQGTGTQPFGGFQATPLVNDGMMYLPNAWGTVYGIDVRSGDKGRIAWIMDPGVDKADVWLPANRGLALYKDMVISIVGNGEVVWTKAETGEMVNSVQVEPRSTGYAITGAPLVINDTVLIPGAGGDGGYRSHLDALNADTGEPVWRTYAIPAPGEPGSETWKDDHNAWKTGGGSFYMTGTWDPDSNLTYWGTGNPVPMFDPEYRPGDNLFTNSTLALDASTGQMKWYFQYTPGDFLDIDEEGVNMVIPVTMDGATRKIVSHFGRNGFYYTLDAADGTFLLARQYMDSQITWTDGIDPKTGKPVEYDPSKDLQTYKIGEPSRRAQGAITTCPSVGGGVNFYPISFSPKTNLVYGAGSEGGCVTATVDPEAIPKGNYMGGAITGMDKQTGSITAVNPATAERVQQHLFDYPSQSGVFTTAGGLAVTATQDGTVYALDDTSLEPLWSFNVGDFITSPPITYAVGDKQYIAILAGASALGQSFIAKAPELSDLQNSMMLFVFSL